MDPANHDEFLNDSIPTLASPPAILQSLPDPNNDVGPSDPQHPLGASPKTSWEAYADNILAISTECSKFFITRNIPDVEAYLSALDPQYHRVLVERMVLQCLEHGDLHTQALADLFTSISDKQSCLPSAFQDGFTLPVAALDIIEAKYPQAVQLFTIILRGAGLDDKQRTELASRYINPEAILPLFLAANDANKRKKRLVQAEQVRKVGKGKKGKGRKISSSGEPPPQVPLVEVNDDIVSPHATSPLHKIVHEPPLPVEAQNYLWVANIYGDGSRSMGCSPTQLAMTTKDVRFLILRLGFTKTFAGAMDYLSDATTKMDHEPIHPQWLTTWVTPHLSALRVVPLTDIPAHRLIPHKGVFSWPSLHDPGGLRSPLVHLD
ncbi:hypothetical protein BD779DRAFT_151189 [Infundibulicybe gibba]|nr:hypothetical protein BD779DRAFT_151189 [Infundibulicybe gibba]